MASYRRACPQDATQDAPCHPYVINNAIVVYRDVSVCTEGRPLQWGTLKEYNQVEKAAGGEMVCFLSHQVFSSEPSFITERARGYP